MNTGLLYFYIVPLEYYCKYIFDKDGIINQSEGKDVSLPLNWLHTFTRASMYYTADY